MTFRARAEGDARARYSITGMATAATILAAVSMYLLGALAASSPGPVDAVALVAMAGAVVLLWWGASASRWRLGASSLTVGTGRRATTVPLSRVKAVALIVSSPSMICVWWDPSDGNLARVHLSGPQAFAFKWQTRARVDAAYWERLARTRAAAATAAITAAVRDAGGPLDLGTGRSLADLVWQIPAAPRDLGVRFWTSPDGGAVDSRL